MKLEDLGIGLMLGIGSYLMFSRVLASLTLFVSFAFLDIYFSRKKLVLINLNAISLEKFCCNFSYNDLF